MSRVLRSSRGFSLIEVLAALFILGVAAATILGVFSSNLRLIKKSQDHIYATIHARSLLDEALVMEDISKARGVNIDLEDLYSGTVQVDSLGRSEDGVEVYEVTVTVQWPPSGSVVLKGRKAVVELE